MEILRQAARLLGRKNKQFETLTEVMIGDWKVRIWRSAKTLEQAKAFAHAYFAEEIRMVCERNHPAKWMDSLMKLPDVACVAIVNGGGNGVSAYPDWY